MKTGSLVLVLCASLSFIVYHQIYGDRPRANTVQLVYFDTGDQVIRIVDHVYPADPASPLEGTDDVFLARVYTCEQEPSVKLQDGMTLEQLNDSGMFIARLEQIDPEVTGEQMIFGKGLTYRTLDDDDWFDGDDPRYAAIQRQLYERCTNPRLCWP